MGRLDLFWKLGRTEIAGGRLDEQFLSGHKNPASLSLPEIPDEAERLKRDLREVIQAGTD